MFVPKRKPKALAKAFGSLQTSQDLSTEIPLLLTSLARQQGRRVLPSYLALQTCNLHRLGGCRWWMISSSHETWLSGKSMKLPKLNGGYLNRNKGESFRGRIYIYIYVNITIYNYISMVHGVQHAMFDDTRMLPPSSASGPRSCPPRPRSRGRLASTPPRPGTRPTDPAASNEIQHGLMLWYIMINVYYILYHTLYIMYHIS